MTVDRPDVRGREKILRVHAENKPFAESVDFERLAKITPGFTGADLANLCNEAEMCIRDRYLDATSKEVATYLGNEKYALTYGATFSNGDAHAVYTLSLIHISPR